MPKTQASPSIHDIVLDQYKLNAKKDIKLIFQKVVYPNFPIHQFQLTGQLAKDPRYYSLVSELHSWNKNNNQSTNSNQNLRAQFTRNQFIYTSLKSIIAHGSIGSQNFQTNLQKLFTWYKNNCKQNHQFNFTSRKKKTIIEDDWKVRKTFKSNMPLEINTYDRRIICIESPVDEQTKQNQKISIFQLEQLKIKQNRLRMERQKEELKQICNKFVKNKRRSVQKIQKNYFIGKFNNTFKFFQKKEQNSLSQKNINTVDFQTGQLQIDFQGFPKFQKAQIIKNQIKKYRLNTSQGFRGRGTQRRSYDPFIRKKQKANTTFSTKTQNSTFQHSLINNNNEYSIRQKQMYSRVQKTSTILSSIDGASLIKNPFQKKKLKKIANRNRNK